MCAMTGSHGTSEKAYADGQGPSRLHASIKDGEMCRFE